MEVLDVKPLEVVPTFFVVKTKRQKKKQVNQVKKEVFDVKPLEVFFVSDI